MSSQIFGILAAASLISTGVTATKETRASQSFPSAKSALARGASKLGTGCVALATPGKMSRTALLGKRSVANNCANRLAQGVPGAPAAGGASGGAGGAAGGAGGAAGGAGGAAGGLGGAAGGLGGAVGGGLGAIGGIAGVAGAVAVGVTVSTQTP